MTKSSAVLLCAGLMVGACSSGRNPFTGDTGVNNSETGMTDVPGSDTGGADVRTEASTSDARDATMTETSVADVRTDTGDSSVPPVDGTVPMDSAPDATPPVDGGGPIADWAVAMHPTGTATINALVADQSADGFIYIAGSFVNGLSIDGDVARAAGRNGAFIAQFTRTGRVRWVKTYIPTSGSDLEITALALTPDRTRVIVFGSALRGTVVSLGTTMIGMDGSERGLVFALSVRADGVEETPVQTWAVGPDSLASAGVTEAVFDSAARLHFGGNYRGNTFDAFPAVMGNSTVDSFVFTRTGTTAAGFAFHATPGTSPGSAYYVLGQAFDADLSGNSVVLVNWNTDANLGGTPVTRSLTDTNSGLVFVSPTGAFVRQWTDGFPGQGPYAMDVLSDGKIAVTSGGVGGLPRYGTSMEMRVTRGVTNCAVTIAAADGTPETFFLLGGNTPEGTADAGGFDSSMTSCMDVGERNTDLLIYGTFNGTIEMSGHTLTAMDFGDYFLAQVSRSGTTRWVRTFGTSNAENLYARVVTGPSGLVCATGRITADTFGLPRAFTMPSGGAYDSFLYCFTPPAS